MKTLFQKLKQNDLIFISLYVVLAALPILLKLLLTGLTGPTFTFYFFVLWIPLLTFSFAVLRSQQGAIFTSLMIIGAFILSFISYPHNPDMDFRRQIVSQLDIWIVLAALASLAFQIAVPRLKCKRGH